MTEFTNFDLAVWARDQANRDDIPLEIGARLEAIANALQSCVSAEDHDARVSELLEANSLLVGRARRAREPRQHDKRGPRPTWRGTHLHYRGREYRLIGACRLEGSARLMFRYVNDRGVEWVRPAEEFLETVRDDNVVRRRFAPMNGEVREVWTDLGAYTGPPDLRPARDRLRITVHEYMLLATAWFLHQGADRAFADRYGHEEWLESWRNGVDPTVAADQEIAIARAAA